MNQIRIELVKVFRRWRTYIAFAIVGLVIILIQVVMKLNEEQETSRLLRQFSSDFLMSGNILNGWFLTALIMNSLYIHVPFLITLVAGDIVSNEASSGTIRLLLIRPPSRTHVLLSKYIAAGIYTLLLTVFLGVLSAGLGLALFGSGDLVTYQTGSLGINIISESEAAIRLLGAFGAAMVSMLTVTSLAFFFSTIVENSTGPIIGTIGIMIAFLVFGALPYDFFQSLKPYLFTSHMNLWQFLLNDPIPFSKFWNSFFILLGHSIGFFLLSWIIFIRKDIKS